MKVKVDDEEVIELSEVRKKVIANDIPMEELNVDLKRRVHWVLQHKYERCMERLKAEWTPKLKAKGHAYIPLDDDALATMIFADPDYKDRSVRVKEEQAPKVKK